MARLAHGLIRPLLRRHAGAGWRTATMAIDGTRATAATVTIAVAVAVALLGGAGGCGKTVCPDGMRLDGKRSQPGVNAYCQSTTDKARTAYLQLHPGGGRRQVCSYLSGRAAGPYQAFHPDGTRWLEGRYENGLKVGRWVQWAPDGRKVADGAYRDGLTVEGAPVGFPATCETITW
ncbi:MAG TPA: hypothetical protein VFH68_09740 [Polyangia bacterium]|nr:hypothetical protein [Polyangia bacterium]